MVFCRRVRDFISKNALRLGTQHVKMHVQCVKKDLGSSGIGCILLYDNDTQSNRLG